jgi:serine/threonine protein kinase/Tol biopolymer transport system component
MALAAGTILGQCEIRSPLGAGGMGEVYRACDTRLNREVAIKVLPESVSADPERLRRFEQEARAAAALNHPNILAVYQMATHGGVSYMVTELLEGETLRERLIRGAIPLRAAIDYGVQIVHGLAAAHEKGIVHRDLKPENLFLAKDGRVKILDFGLAKLTQPQTASEDEKTVTLNATEPGVVMGTVGYMSPEQVRGASADHRSDIFAFGTIFYEMVTGKQTFRKPTSPETMTAILNEDPPSISQLAPNTPPGIQRVVHRCLEKNPEQRFHAAHDLAFALEAMSDSAISATAGHPSERPRPDHLRSVVAGVFAAVVLGAAVLVYFAMRPEAAPKVFDYIQLTHDGQRKQLVATDGSRLYLLLGTDMSHSVGAISISGGEPTRIPTQSPDMAPAGLSPNGSELVLVEAKGDPPSGPLWSLPVLGGSPRRLGDTEGNAAAWSPDGTMLAYSNGADLFLAKEDGSESRKLITMKGGPVIHDPVWSRDNTHLRFAARDGVSRSKTLWEVSVDGTGLHCLLPTWNKPSEGQCCGKWTADGKYFVFGARGQIWALPRKPSFFGSETKPIQLTFSPLTLDTPLPSKDGKQLFVVGRTFRGQLVRYDSKSGEFSPFLGGISAEYVDFSKDGKWVAYVSYPEGTLWRSRADGSERLQLSYPPGYAVNPRWSPDGKKVVFFEMLTNKPSRIVEVSADGGSQQRLMPDDPVPQWDPNWSPDGSKIVFGGSSESAASTISILDLASHKVSPLPGSEGLYGPRWSSDGRYIEGLSADETIVFLFDFQTQKWTQLAKGGFAWPNFSKDSQYLYVLSGHGGSSVLKIRLSDGKAEQVADLKNFVYTGHFSDSSLSLTPDDSLLLFRDAGTSDVYALDWVEP